MVATQGREGILQAPRQRGGSIDRASVVSVWFRQGVPTRLQEVQPRIRRTDTQRNPVSLLQNSTDHGTVCMSRRSGTSGGLVRRSGQCGTSDLAWCRGPRCSTLYNRHERIS